MKKLVLGLLMSVFLVSPANALEGGFGVDLNNFSGMSFGAKVYVPLNITPALRLEPHLLYFDDESESVGSSGTSVNSRTETELGIGVFGVQVFNQSTKLYFGGRLTYVAYEEYSSSAFSTNTTDYDGFRIAPTLGFEYFFSEKISLGGDASWYYMDIDMERISTSGNSTGSDEMTGTETEVIVRYYF